MGVIGELDDVARRICDRTSARLDSGIFKVQLDTGEHQAYCSRMAARDEILGEDWSRTTT